MPTASLRVLRDSDLDGPTNMARDEALAHSDMRRPAALRIYGWSPPTISLGYFQRFADLAALPDELRGLAVVRRCTGGGAILHDREITYCLVLDDSLPIARQEPAALYTLVHECWRTAIVDAAPHAALAPGCFPLPTPRDGPFFCFQKPGRTDLLLDGRKLLGSAQRRAPGYVLQHGSLLLAQRFVAHPGGNLGDPDAERATLWTDRFIAALAETLGLIPVAQDWTPDLLADASARRATYADENWTRRR